MSEPGGTNATGHNDTGTFMLSVGFECDGESLGEGCGEGLLLSDTFLFTMPFGAILRNISMGSNHVSTACSRSAASTLATVTPSMSIRPP